MKRAGILVFVGAMAHAVVADEHSFDAKRVYDKLDMRLYERTPVLQGSSRIKGYFEMGTNMQVYAPHMSTMPDPDAIQSNCVYRIEPLRIGNHDDGSKKKAPTMGTRVQVTRDGKQTENSHRAGSLVPQP